MWVSDDRRLSYLDKQLKKNNEFFTGFKNFSAN